MATHVKHVVEEAEVERMLRAGGTRVVEHETEGVGHGEILIEDNRLVLDPEGPDPLGLRGFEVQLPAEGTDNLGFAFGGQPVLYQQGNLSALPIVGVSVPGGPAFNVFEALGYNVKDLKDGHLIAPPSTRIVPDLPSHLPLSTLNLGASVELQTARSLQDTKSKQHMPFPPNIAHSPEEAQMRPEARIRKAGQPTQTVIPRQERSSGQDIASMYAGSSQSGAEKASTVSRRTTPAGVPQPVPIGFGQESSVGRGLAPANWRRPSDLSAPACAAQRRPAASYAVLGTAHASRPVEHPEVVRCAKAVIPSGSTVKDMKHTIDSQQMPYQSNDRTLLDQHHVSPVDHYQVTGAGHYQVQLPIQYQGMQMPTDFNSYNPSEAYHYPGLTPRAAPAERSKSAGTRSQSGRPRQSSKRCGPAPRRDACGTDLPSVGALAAAAFQATSDWFNSFGGGQNAAKQKEKDTEIRKRRAAKRREMQLQRMTPSMSQHADVLVPNQMSTLR